MVTSNAVSTLLILRLSWICWLICCLTSVHVTVGRCLPPMEQSYHTCHSCVTARNITKTNTVQMTLISVTFFSAASITSEVTYKCPSTPVQCTNFKRCLLCYFSYLTNLDVHLLQTKTYGLNITPLQILITQSEDILICIYLNIYHI